MKPESQTPNAEPQTPNPELILIAAVAEENRAIGKEGKLPWHLPEDLKRFKQLTLGHPLLMGRRTFESLVDQFGGPLPGRRNVVLTSQGPLTDWPDVETYASTEEAMQVLEGSERIFIGGGGAVYEQFLPQADRLELTLVEGDYQGDAFFPAYEHLVGPVFEVAEEDERDGFRFVTYRRTSEA